MTFMPSALQDVPEACRILFRHWDDIRGPAIVPRRSQLDLAKLIPILPVLQIVEVQSRSMLRCKLVGTGLRNLFGFEFTGRNYLDLAPPDGRRIRAYRHWAGIQQPCGSVFSGCIRYPSGAVASVIGIGVPLLADQEGAPPMSLTVTAQVTDRGWINERSREMIGMPEHFEFLDIGAGIPASTKPPEDWRMDGN
jgi:hypothetical protein